MVCIRESPIYNYNMMRIGVEGSAEAATVVLSGKNYDGFSDDNCSIRMESEVLSTTVWCTGIAIDPLDPQCGKLYMSALLAKPCHHYVPYLGLYATVRTKGVLQISDEIDVSRKIGFSSLQLIQRTEMTAIVNFLFF